MKYFYWSSWNIFIYRVGIFLFVQLIDFYQIWREGMLYSVYYSRSNEQQVVSSSVLIYDGKFIIYSQLIDSFIKLLKKSVVLGWRLGCVVTILNLFQKFDCWRLSPIKRNNFNWENKSEIWNSLIIWSWVSKKIQSI